MDDVVNRLARELADAIAAAVAANPQVEACREQARAAGFEMKVTLEAVVGFARAGSSRRRSRASRHRLAWFPCAAGSRSPPTIAVSCGRCVSQPTRPQNLWNR